MSQKSSFSISCPLCGHPQTVELWEAINIQDDPGLRDALIGNQINVVECEACHKQFRVDKNLVYVDPDQDIMVHLEPPVNGRTLEDISNSFVDAIQTLQRQLPKDITPPDVHLVIEWPELLERIFILEEGLDVRIVEHIKYMMHQQNPAQLPADKKRLLFDAQDSSGDQLCFVVQDLETRRLESMLHFSRADYEGLLNVFDGDDQTALLLEQFPGPYFNGRLRYLQDQEDLASAESDASRDT